MADPAQVKDEGMEKRMDPEEIPRSGVQEASTDGAAAPAESADPSSAGQEEDKAVNEKPKNDC